MKSCGKGMKLLDFTLSDKDIEKCHTIIATYRPYTDSEMMQFSEYFDLAPGEDPYRGQANSAMHLLKYAGLWTAEDEQNAFGSVSSAEDF